VLIQYFSSYLSELLVFSAFDFNPILVYPQIDLRWPQAVLIALALSFAKVAAFFLFSNSRGDSFHSGLSFEEVSVNFAAFYVTVATIHLLCESLYFSSCSWPFVDYSFCFEMDRHSDTLPCPYFLGWYLVDVLTISSSHFGSSLFANIQNLLDAPVKARACKLEVIVRNREISCYASIALAMFLLYFIDIY